jgi:plasmid stability protein
MARTTIDLDATVLEQLRHRAAIEHKSMGQLASERLAVALRESHDNPMPLQWPSKRMGKANIDLQDKDALWNALDQNGDARRERQER